MNATQYLEKTPLKEILGIPDAALHHVRSTAFSLFKAGRLDHVETLCKGLIAADHRDPWAYGLYAAALGAEGRPEEGLLQIERGLKFNPGVAKLVTLRKKLEACVAAKSPVAKGGN